MVLELVLLGADTGISIEERGSKFLNIATKRVSALGRPFRCLAAGRCVRPLMSRHVPNFDCVGEDQEGRSQQVDRRFEAALSGAAALGNPLAEQTMVEVHVH